MFKNQNKISWRWSYKKKIPIVDSNHTCLTIDSALKKDANYYPQAFLKES